MNVLTLILLMFAASASCFLYLDRGAVYYDEAIYAQVAKEIVRTDQWLTLHWNQQPWFHKPPLYFWGTALLFKLFGVSELMARVISGAGGIGCAALTYLIAKQIKDELAGLIAGLVLISSALFVFNARHGMTDVTMTFFVLLSIYAYLRLGANPRWWWIAGIASALAVLTKGAAGLFAPLIITIASVLDARSRETLRNKHFWIGTSIFFVLAGSWHVVSLVLHGRTFLDQYLFRHVLERSTSDLHKYNYSYFFYFGVLWNFFWPWILLAVPAIFVSIKKRWSSVLVVAALLPFFLFSLATTKFQWYLVPVLPPLAIMIALLIRELLERISRRMNPVVWLTFLAMAVIGGIDIAGYSKPEQDIQAVAELARMASKDQGAISTAPESFEMTALFYSDRKLCADHIVSPLSYEGSTKCEPGEIRHFIFKNDKRSVIEARFGPLEVLAERNGISYGKILAH